MQLDFHRVADEDIERYFDKASDLFTGWLLVMVLLTPAILVHSFKIFDEYEERVERAETWGVYVPGYANSFSLATNVAIFSCNLHIFILNGLIATLDKETQIFWVSNILRVVLSLVIMAMSGVQLEA